MDFEDSCDNSYSADSKSIRSKGEFHDDDKHFFPNFYQWIFFFLDCLLHFSFILFLCFALSTSAYVFQRSIYSKISFRLAFPGRPRPILKSLFIGYGKELKMIIVVLSSVNSASNPCSLFTYKQRVLIRVA